jgi:hypothetical protein
VDRRPLAVVQLQVECNFQCSLYLGTLSHVFFVYVSLNLKPMICMIEFVCTNHIWPKFYYGLQL